MRKKLAYIFTVPASLLFLIAEKIRGEKIGWRVREVIGDKSITCSKCGHRGKIRLLDI